ncbi:hypothetical protein M569_01363, partial [Genlisea aurea]
VRGGLRELRERIETVKNTQKVTEAMKLVAAAKIRRAQEAVVSGRPFAETLVDVLHDVNEQCKSDDVEVPLTAIRAVKKVALVVVSGERGLCGGFNAAILRKAESRIAELKGSGLDCSVISVGRKGNSYLRRRGKVEVENFIEGDDFPTSKEAQVIADQVFSLFVSEEVDRVEILYTKFVSLMSSDPAIQTLLPLSKAAAAGDDDDDDEIFRLTSREGKLAVVTSGKKKTMARMNYEFEQDPALILDALMPLYLNSQILRALQESHASELASRMNAMSSATSNAAELKKSLSVAYNRERQSKITSEILEIVAGA